MVDVRRPIRLGATYTTSRTSRYSVSDLGFRRRNWHRWRSDSIVLEFCLVENLETPTGVGGAAVCCMAMPVCDSGDSQIANAATCPSNSTCYSRAVCCSQIWCSHAGAPPQDAAACNPEPPVFHQPLPLYDAGILACGRPTNIEYAIFVVAALGLGVSRE